MRRLPIYLLLNVSGSMVGEPIKAVRNGVQMLIAQARGVPQALEVVYLSVITFAIVAKRIVPLTDLSEFEEPILDVIDSESIDGARLGEALGLLCNIIDSEINESTYTEKGDYRPWIFLMASGRTTDNWQKSADELRKRKTFAVAFNAGSEENIEI